MTGESLPTEYAPAEKSPEYELKRQIQKFSDTSVQQFMDYMPNIVVVLNSNRQIVFANIHASPLFEIREKIHAYGLRPGELLDCTHAGETPGGCGTTRFCAECGSLKAVLSALTGHEDVQECRITQKKSGDSIDLRVWTYPLTIDNELFAVYILNDIGNEKRRTFLERIFLHDIMNTVGNIHSFAEILTEASSDEAEEFRELIYNLSARLIDEINAHRELVLAENNELSVHPVPINTKSLLSEIRDSYSRTDLAKQNKIELAPGATEFEITGDRVLLNRILGNMLKNALEASVPGDIVTLDVEKKGEEVVFTVHNPGYIPNDIQLQIFQRSFSTKGAGRGLGTYSIRLLSERYLKGRVSFTSSETEGTTFYATYPLELTAD